MHRGGQRQAQLQIRGPVDELVRADAAARNDSEQVERGPFFKAVSVEWCDVETELREGIKEQLIPPLENGPGNPVRSDALVVRHGDLSLRRLCLDRCRYPVVGVSGSPRSLFFAF